MNKIKVILGVVVLNILFGTSFPIIKTILIYFTPKEWCFIRVVLYTLVLCLWVGRKLWSYPLELRDFFWLILGALSGMLVNQISFVEGLHRTSPAHSAIISTTIPSWAMLLATFFLKEKMRLSHLFGLIAGILGVAILLELDHGFQASPYLNGDLLSLLNAIAYSIFLVISRKHLSRMNPMISLTLMSLFALIGTGFYSSWDFPLDKLKSLPLSVDFMILYAIIVLSIVTFLICLWTLRHMEASKASFFVLIQPIVAAVLSFLMQAEVPSHRFYVSTCLIFAGIILGNLKRS